jgi:putative redox protein
MDAKVTWQGKLTFTGSADSGFPVQLGSDPEVGGDNDGLRPMELIAIGLAGCTAMDVISILKKKRQDVTAFEVRVQADTAEQHPKVYRIVGRDVDPVAVERALELSQTKYCPAQAMLSKAVPIKLAYTITNQIDKVTNR